jgi:hypothetical protein
MEAAATAISAQTPNAKSRANGDLLEPSIMIGSDVSAKARKSEKHSLHRVLARYDLDKAPHTSLFAAASSGCTGSRAGAPVRERVHRFEICIQLFLKSLTKNILLQNPGCG